MQIKETENEGLKRAYTVTIPAKEIDERVNSEVKKIAPQVKMPGFRPGKVPANLVRKMHGEQLHAQTVNDLIRESVDKVMSENKLRPAMQPKIELGDGYEEGKDAKLSVDLEVLPEVEAPEVEGLELERLTVPVSDEQVDEALQRIADQNKSYKDAAKTKKAGDGDQLIIDFVGRVDGEEFEGGKAENTPLVIGSGQFIPGFEDQLVTSMVFSSPVFAPVSWSSKPGMNWPEPRRTTSLPRTSDSIASTSSRNCCAASWSRKPMA